MAAVAQDRRSVSIPPSLRRPGGASRRPLSVVEPAPPAACPVGGRARPRPVVADVRAPVAVAVTVVMVLALGGWLVDRVVPAGAGPGGAPSSAPEPVPMPVPVPVPVAPGPVPGGRHLVQPGDTYWSLAVALDQPGDVRARVDALQRANGGRPLHVGDLVVLPQ